jgi:hypothetical protein
MSRIRKIDRLLQVGENAQQAVAQPGLNLKRRFPLNRCQGNSAKPARLCAVMPE